MPNPYLAEYNMICDLVDQVKWNNVWLEEVKDRLRVAMLPDTDTPEESLQEKFDAMLNDNKMVMEKARQTLESLK